MNKLLFLLITSLFTGATVTAQVKAIIPVVFHVIYSNDKQNEIVSDSLLRVELNDLRLDFLGENSDLSTVPEEFRPLIGKAGIEFILASKDPNGAPTTGIIRKKVANNNYTFGNPIFDADSIWDTKRYLNVYIGLIRNGRTHGYVDNTTPWKWPKKDAIGLSYTADIGKHTRLLTHEAGHWLGLVHIFAKNFWGKCLDDGIKDTPLQGHETGLGSCPSYPDLQCGHSTMFVNFMDYSACRRMFSIGQVEKMDSVLRTHRKEFLITAH